MECSGHVPADEDQENQKPLMTHESDMPMTAYIGLGGNLDNTLELLASARKAIATVPSIREIAFSSLYRSLPMGSANQPNYVNAVMAVETSLSPHDLLKTLQQIELSHGRVRSGLRWEPRTLDLDLLLYGHEQISDEWLTVPHEGIANREFVLYPLAEIAPSNLTIPGLGLLCDLATACPSRGMEVIGNG
jgi:2-amino-4-hydroxy-6-hydroxymethyldihydropteridine diphosphokinase